MKKLLWTISLLSSFAFAQEQETRSSDYSDFQTTAGGPSEASPGTNASDLSISYEETDATIATGVGSLEVKRRYSSRQLWKSMPVNADAFGSATAYPGSWFSTFSSYAIFRYQPPHNTPQVDGKRWIQIRDVSGDLATTPTDDPTAGPLDQVLAASGGGVIRVTTKAGNGAGGEPSELTLLRPGQGRWTYEPYKTVPFGGGTAGWQAIYRLSRVYGPEYGTEPICTFIYGGLDPTKVTRLDCAGGLRLSVGWGAFGITELKESAGGTLPVGERTVAQFTYASGQLISASRSGIRRDYAYTSRGSTGFTVSEGDASGSSAYFLFSKQQQHPPLGCNGLPDGGLGAGFWFGPPANDQTGTTLGEWTYDQPTAACNSAPRTTVDNPQGSGLNLQEQFVVSREKGITTSTTRICQQNGNPCTDVRNTSQQWSIDWNKPQPVDEWFRDRRGVFNTTTAVEDVDQRASVELRTTLVTAQSLGATDAAGSGALKRLTFGWLMFDETGTREPMLESVTTVSALVPGESASSLFKFDKNTRHRRAEFRTGWTHDANGTNVKKTIATFFFPRTMCDGQGPIDTNGRTIEVHGPCFVSSTAATDCDVATTNEQIPITRFRYHSWDPQQAIPANAGRLASKTTFHTTNAATCSTTNALTTEFNEYDVAGHVLRETSPAGVVTTRKYTDGNLERETVGSLTTKYWYSTLQGGRLAGKQSPTGVWEVYCYRYGASSADCSGGTLTNNLQWKARIEGTGPSGNWAAVERTDFTYEQKPGALYSPGEGRLVSERTTRGQSTVQTKYTYDALDRKSTTSVADLTGNPLYSTQTAYDANGNELGSSVPSTNAPVACGGLTTNAHGLEEAASAMCARSFYDRLSRLERTSSEGAVATTSFTYDKGSNLETITDNRGQLVRYETDDFGNVVTIYGRWGMSLPIQQSFDAQGKLRFKTSPVTGRVEFRYDAIGRPVFSGTTVGALWQRGYDGQTTPVTNCPAVSNALKGRLQWQDDSFGRTWFDYDTDGRVTALRRVRAGATACGTPPSSTSTNPDTTFIYDSVGRLTQQKYPHGLWVRYNWGEAGHQEEIIGIDYDPFGGQVFVPLVDSIAYDLSGLAGYTIRSTTPVSVNYYRKGSQTIPTDCAFDPPGQNDGSGRMSTMQVKRGSTNLLLRRYGWNAQQLTRQATCLLAATTPLNETFQYDALQQLSTATRPAGEFSAHGGPYAELSYTFQNATERRYEASLGATSDTWWEHVYDAYGRQTAQSPRNALNDAVDRSWYRRAFAWNSEGTMTSILETGVPAAPKDFYGRRLAMTPAIGLGNVYRSLSVNGAAYQYIYDANNRRRLKIYPSGRSDEFFYDGEHLIEDQGLVSTTIAGSGHVYDQYIWLGNMPVAIVRQRFSELGVRDTVTTDCKRNGEAATCGTFFVVNDYLPKPVALVDSAGRLAGVGEYDAFGRVNTVSMRADAPAYARTDGQNYPFGVYTPFHGSIATFKVPLRGGAVGRARVNYALVNTSSANDKTQIRSGLRCNVNVSPAYTGQLNAFATPWFSVGSGTQYCVSWDANATGGHGGAVTSTFEYQLHETSVASPSWLPLRFPGQYADIESGLFENWNRHFDPLTGKFQANDLILPNTTATNIYRYAANNPLAFIDPSGLREFKPDELAAIKQAIERIDKVDGLKAMKMRLLLGEGLLEAFDRSEFNERYPGAIKQDQSLDDIAGIAFAGRVFVKEFNTSGGLDATLVHELNHHENTPSAALDLDLPDAMSERASGLPSLAWSMLNPAYQSETEYKYYRDLATRRCYSNRNEKGCRALLSPIPAIGSAR